jgi:1-acyl-sn-glycerol-3-phosphate acyltransferase
MVEPLGTVVVRRLFTVSSWLIIFNLLNVLSPLLVLAALVYDVPRKNRFTGVRTLFYGWCFFAIELCTVVAMAWLTLRYPNRAKRLPPIHRLQDRYTGLLFWACSTAYSLRFKVTGEENIGKGPLLVFPRHASVIDTILPGVYLSARHGYLMRYVLKRELRVDPCLDISSDTLHNHFVERGSKDADKEIAAIAALKEGIGDLDAVLIYPEGTRYSPAKQRRALEKLAEREPAQHAKALHLKHLLPPRMGGTLALLDHPPKTDVLFLAHHGLEGFASVRDILSGRMVGQLVQIHFRRVPAQDIPADEKARIDWFYEQWLEVDRWIDEVGRAAST